MKPRALEDWVVAALDTVTRRRWGFRAHLAAPLVKDFGALRAAWWSLWNFLRYERTLAHFGPVRTHLLGTAIALVNGCSYCGYGHGYALELVFLREHGTLFPLDEAQLGELCKQAPALIHHRLLGAVRSAGLHSDAAWLDRTIALALSHDPRPTDRDDLRVVHLVRMLGTLATVATANNTPRDGAHDPVNKDAELQHRYHALRSPTDT